MDFFTNLLSGLGDAVLKNLVILIPPMGAITFFVQGLRTMWKRATGKDINKIVLILLPSFAGVVYLFAFQKSPYNWKFILIAGVSLGVFNNFLYVFFIKRFFEMLRARALAKVAPPNTTTNPRPDKEPT